MAIEKPALPRQCLSSFSTFFVVLSLFFVSCAANAAGTSANEGDSTAGHVYARRICAQCHNITTRAERPSPASKAPAFLDIANAKTTSIIGLNAFLMTPHSTMPNLIIAAEDRRNVIAYILSLRHKKNADPSI